jgi:hypothetical protein
MSLSPKDYADSFSSTGTRDSGVLLYRGGKIVATSPCGCDGWWLKLGKTADGVECVIDDFPHLSQVFPPRNDHGLYDEESRISQSIELARKIRREFDSLEYCDSLGIDFQFPYNRESREKIASSLMNTLAGDNRLAKIQLIPHRGELTIVDKSRNAVDIETAPLPIGVVPHDELESGRIAYIALYDDDSYLLISWQVGSMKTDIEKLTEENIGEVSVPQWIPFDEPRLLRVGFFQPNIYGNNRILRCMMSDLKASSALDARYKEVLRQSPKGFSA